MQNNLDKEKELLNTIKDLVSFKTTEKRFDEFDRTVNYVKNFFAEANVTIFEHRYNNHPALVITTKGTKHPHILLQGHLDVVNGKSEQFIPRVEGDKLYGRGTVDMKGFVALAMHAVRELSSEDFDIGLMITFDEEIGSANGVARLVEEGYSCDILFNGDGGYNYAVIYGEKGILKFKLSVDTDPGRHPFPWNGESAFEVFVEEYEKIKELFPGSKLATDADNWHTTYSLYDIKAENKEFYPPHHVEARMNIYFARDVSVAELFDLINSTLSRTKTQLITGSERVYLNPDSPYAQSLRRIMERNFGREIVLRTENGSSDARFYANKGIPIVIVKMVGEDHHGENEHIFIPAILPMYKTILDFITEHCEFKLETSDEKSENI
jgi:succinyl-diaminopimelate desuccinylase